MDLCENFCNRFPFVGNRKGTSRLGHNDLVLRESQRSSNGRVEIWNSHATLAHFAAFAVSGSMDIASSDATTCQQATESLWIVISPRILIDLWRAAKFRSQHDKRVFQQASPIKID